ncbi:hypothetical protein OG21DRAFT_1524511 [Imleria badia]|nr:hypothetical protein OG21DRAFT_1524511 [Imleria badia]
MPKKSSNKHKRARDSLDVSIQPTGKGLVTMTAGLVGARFKNPFLKGAISTGNVTSAEITRPDDAATAYLIPSGAIPPHPPQSYDSLLPKHRQYAAFQQPTEPEQAHSPAPAIMASGTETNAGVSDACIDPAIIESDLIVASLVKANTGQQHQAGTGKQLNDPPIATPSSSKSAVTNSQAPPLNGLGPESIQSASKGKAATIPKLQEEVDNNNHTIQDQEGKIKTLRDKIATLQEAQGQHTTSGKPQFV